MCIFQYLTPNQQSIGIHACVLLVVTINYGDKETMDNITESGSMT